jgi:hypothetical protein
VQTYSPAGWVPKSISKKQMAMRASVFSVLLKCLRSKDEFLSRLVTVDETWVHYNELKNKSQSRQWVGPGNYIEKEAVDFNPK